MNVIIGGAIFLVYALISCTGLYWLKSAENLWTIRFISGAIFYVVGAGIWLVILKIYPLSLAFPIASGILVIGTTLVGYFLLRENITWLHMLGLVLISSGISVLVYQANS